MLRSIACVLTLLNAADGGGSVEARTSPPRPSFVVILIDDLRADALGCTGHPFAQTPRIDALAREGMRFTSAFVTTPICLPSRASFLTGQYAHRHGVTFGGDSNQIGQTLGALAMQMQSAGYTTAFVGKWHVGGDAGPRPGFDRWVSFRGQGEYVDPQLNIEGKGVQATGYVTDLLTDHAVEFLRQPHERPFLLWISHKGVHAPFVPAERHREQYRDVAIPRAASVDDDLTSKPALTRPGVVLQPGDSDLDTSDDLVRNQLRCLASVDESVGRILAALDSAGHREDTLVVFTSDNGYFWGEHGLGGKHGPYEEAVRVPFLARYPQRIQPGTVRDALVLNVDLAPTLLELAGLAVPDSIDGRSIVPLFADSFRWRDAVLLEYQLNRGQTPRFPTWQAVRTRGWKYIRYPDNPAWDELYELSTDPLEMHNRIADPDSGTVLGELQLKLQRLLEETRAR
jgi:N-acetylglucosamine-6-sulfatase